MNARTMPTPASILRDSGKRQPFAAVAIGEQFECNGTLCRKVSRRSGVIVWPAAPESAFAYDPNAPVYAATQPPLL